MGVLKRNEMKKVILILLLMWMLSGCAVKKYCFILPGLSEVKTVTVGSVMIKKWECFGRVTVNDCREPLELIYLGRTHPGNYIRIASRAGDRTQIIAEATYPENSKLIEFQDAKLEVIEASDNWIRFKLVRISTSGCDKVNGQEVK
jgi:hypothetical protein